MDIISPSGETIDLFDVLSPSVVYYAEIPAGLENTTGSVLEVSDSPPVSSTNSICDIHLLKQTCPKPAEDPVQEVPLKDVTTLVFLDLEATGLPQFMGKTNVHITEISLIAVSMFDFMNSEALNLSDIRVINKLSLCIKPRTRVSIDAAKITGLNDSNLFRQQPFNADVGQMISTFITRLPQPACLVAHNGNQFDFPLLKAELQRVGIVLSPDTLIADTLVAFRTVYVPESTVTNTQKKTCRNKSSKKNWVYSLENLYRGLIKKRAVVSHNSESDCQMLMLVCHKMKDKILPWIQKNKQYFNTVSPLW